MSSLCFEHLLDNYVLPNAVYSVAYKSDHRSIVQYLEMEMSLHAVEGAWGWVQVINEEKPQPTALGVVISAGHSR